MARTKASFEAFKNDVAGLRDPDLEWFLLDELKAKRWEDVRSWLEACVEPFLVRRLRFSRYYRQLLRVAPRFGVPAFDPKGFKHAKLPVESQAYLALRYRTPETLRQCAMNPHTPRGDVLAARILGLLTQEEFERAPVKFNNEGRYTVRRRRRKN